MAFASETLKTSTGADLNVYHAAAADPKAVIQINHGLAEHAARYARFAETLTKAGYHVYAQDHRGHGQTRAPDAPQGVFSLDGDGVSKVLADITSLHDHIRDRHGDLPLVMFGHSMGGNITMNYALRHPEGLSGAAVWNSNFSGGAAGRGAQGILAYERMRLGSDVSSRLLPKLTFGAWAKAIKPRRNAFDWLSHIESEVDAYIADPLCGWDASVSLWQDLFSMIYGGANVTAYPDAKTLPFHLAGGGKDPATLGGKAVLEQERRLRKAGFTDVSCTIFSGARHETLNDTVADVATKGFIDWADRVTKAKSQ